jgi:hypothetical protein
MCCAVFVVMPVSQMSAAAANTPTMTIPASPSGATADAKSAAGAAANAAAEAASPKAVVPSVRLIFIRHGTGTRELSRGIRVTHVLTALHTALVFALLCSAVLLQASRRAK